MRLEKSALTEHTRLRIQVAKEYFDAVRKKMGKWFINAYVFGSTCRNEAQAHSDIDMILVLNRPSKEYRRWLNSEAGGIFALDRNGLVIMTPLEQYTRIFLREFEERYRAPLSPYYYYPNNEHNDGDCFLSGSLQRLLKIDDHRRLFEAVTKDTICYPEDFRKLL